MKTPIVFVLLMTLSIYSCIGKVVIDKPGEFKITKEKYSFIQEYAFPDGNHLTLGTVGGNIKVKGYEGNRVKVAFIVTKNTGEVLEMTLDELQKYANFVITKEGTELTIQIKEVFKKNMSVGFNVEAPVNTLCSISTSGGNLSISNLIGDQELHTSGGNIHMEQVRGNLNAHTSGGNISIEKITGSMKVSTSGGNIGGENLTGDLRANTSGGNISLENHEGMAEVSTSGGNISLENMSGAVSASTSGGNVHATLKSITQKLELQTNGGSISCELPSGVGLDLNLSANYIKSSLENFQGTSSPDRISGQMNGGGIPVRMSCPGGGIKLKFSNSSNNQ